MCVLLESCGMILTLFVLCMILTLIVFAQKPTLLQQHPTHTLEKALAPTPPRKVNSTLLRGTLRGVEHPAASYTFDGVGISTTPTPNRLLARVSRPMARNTLEQNLVRLRSPPATHGKAGDVEQARLFLLKAGYTYTSTGISTTTTTLNRLFTRLS